MLLKVKSESFLIHPMTKRGAICTELQKLDFFKVIPYSNFSFSYHPVSIQFQV